MVFFLATALAAPDAVIPGEPSSIPGPPERPLLGPVVAHTVGLLAVMRLSEAALWPEPFARPTLAGYADTFSHRPTFEPSRKAFTWDGDPVWLNVGGHGLLGSELLVRLPPAVQFVYRARRCGLSPWAALGVAVAASTAWEYGFEGNVRRASAQDLLFTPVAGFALGELRFLGSQKAHQPWIRALVDPFGAAERALGAGC